MVIFYNVEYIKDFVLKEDKFEKVAMEVSTAPLVGILLKNGAAAMHERSILNELFHYDALAGFVPEICSITHELIVNFNKINGVNGDSYTKVNIDLLVIPIFEQMLNILVFGDRKVGNLENGLSPYVSICDWFFTLPLLRAHLLYNLMPWVCQNFNILESSRKIWRANDYMLKFITRMYN